MGFMASLTGTYPPTNFPPPPLSDRDVRESIHRAVQHQRKAVGDTGVEWLFVDGQPRSDIVGIFAAGCGLEGSSLPYQVVRPVEYLGPITLGDLQIAAQEAPDQPFKAHITGPTLMAESCAIAPEMLDLYGDDPRSPHQLTLDLAHALAQEVQALLSAPGLSITHVQIDEPTLVYGANLELASKAVGVVAQAARDVGVPVILHVCGDVGDIMTDLLEMPVDILNLVDTYLNALPWLDADALSENKKKLAIGCIPVDTEDIPSARWLVRELSFALERYGSENIWGITPHCGLRMSDLDLAQKRMDRLVEVTAAISAQLG